MSNHISNNTDNKAYWLAQVEHTELYKDLSFLRKVAAETAKGTMKVCQIVSGIGGIGKTHIYTRALDAAGRPYEYIKAGSVLGLLQDLERCASQGIVAFIDDPKQEFLTAENFQLVFMTAAGPEPREFSYATKGKKRIFSFKGLQLIILTNFDLTENSRSTDLFAPLLTRFWSCRIGGDRQDVFKMACFLAICKDMLRQHGASLVEANAALAYLAENMHRLPDVSARTLVKIVTLMKQMPSCWREAMDRERIKGSASAKSYVGETPRIILDRPKASMLPTQDAA